MLEQTLSYDDALDLQTLKESITEQRKATARLYVRFEYLLANSTKNEADEAFEAYIHAWDYLDTLIGELLLVEPTYGQVVYINIARISKIKK